jgi:hypothetical protein
MVYVDKVVRYSIKINGYQEWCHLLADTLEELHGFALQIGLKRAWFQNKKFPHYDLVPSKREIAVCFGAKEINIREYLKKKMFEKREQVI